MTVLMPILRTRAVSRTPEPLNVISIILSLTPGLLRIVIGELKHVRTDRRGNDSEHGKQGASHGDIPGQCCNEDNER